MRQSGPRQRFIGIIPSRTAVFRGNSPTLARKSRIVTNGIGERVQVSDTYLLELFRVEAPEVAPGSKGTFEDGGAMLKLSTAARHDNEEQKASWIKQRGASSNEQSSSPTSQGNQESRMNPRKSNVIQRFPDLTVERDEETRTTRAGTSSCNPVVVLRYTVIQGIAFLRQV